MNNEIDLNKYPYYCDRGHHFDDSFIGPQSGCIECQICFEEKAKQGEHKSFLQNILTKILLKLVGTFVCNRNFGEDEWDSMLLEDNKTHKCIPGSGPQHYVGQILKYRNGRKPIICTKVSDSHSLWKEIK